MLKLQEPNSESSVSRRRHMTPVEQTLGAPVNERDQWRRGLELAFADPRVPVVTNVDARQAATGDACRDALV